MRNQGRGQNLKGGFDLPFFMHKIGFKKVKIRRFSGSYRKIVSARDFLKYAHKKGRNKAQGSSSRMKLKGVNI